MKILILNGPNLNLLGERSPDIYGKITLEKINERLRDKSLSLNIETEFYQSNHEGDIIDKIHVARNDFDGIVLNAGAFTHYSYAIRDAIDAVKIPCVEVHLSNVFAREEFRTKSVISAVCAGTISGFGENSYYLAIIALKEILS